MERKCAWCGRSLDDPPVKHLPGTKVSHGICSTCHDRLAAGSGVPIARFLEELDEPVLLMDADHTVGMVNEAALDLLGQGADAVLGERTGTVFDCENAHMPGGCGATIHCSGCVIRQAVAHTHLTGEPRTRIPATLRVVDDADLGDVELVVSTVLLDGRVLLKIDSYTP